MNTKQQATRAGTDNRNESERRYQNTENPKNAQEGRERRHQEREEGLRPIPGKLHDVMNSDDKTPGAFGKDGTKPDDASNARYRRDEPHRK